MSSIALWVQEDSPRHASLNDLVYRGLIRTGFPSTKEPEGLMRSDGRRPDSLAVVPWGVGRCLVWDATVTGRLLFSLPDTPPRQSEKGPKEQRSANTKNTIRSLPC